MSNKQLTILAIVAAAMLAWAVIQNRLAQQTAHVSGAVDDRALAVAFVFVAVTVKVVDAEFADDVRECAWGKDHYVGEDSSVNGYSRHAPSLFSCAHLNSYCAGSGCERDSQRYLQEFPQSGSTPCPAVDVHQVQEDESDTDECDGELDRGFAC